MQGSDDAVFLYAFESVVPPLVEAFRPDIVVAVIGADTHREDLLGHLNLTSIGYERAIQNNRQIIAEAAGDRRRRATTFTRRRRSGPLPGRHSADLSRWTPMRGS